MVVTIPILKGLALMHRRALAILLLTLILALTTVIPMFVQSNNTNISVTVDEYGLVHVLIVLSLSEGLHKVSLPIEPLIPTINVVYDGEALPTIYDDGHLYLVLNKDLSVTISYIANVSMVNNVFYFDIRTDDIVKIEVNENIILLSWPEENVVDISLNQEILVLYVKGPTTIRYTIKQRPITYTPPKTTQTPTITEVQPSTPTPTSTPITTPTTTPTHQQVTQIQNNLTSIYVVEQPKEGLQLYMILTLIAVTAGVCGTLYYLFFIKKRRHLSSVLDMLGDVDIAIIKVLESRGGSALQTELQNEVKVPKTTLWRHIRKLEKLGIVKVEKVGLQNKVVLVKKIKFS